jgi:ubiquinone biosynthesis protein COQ9
MTKPRKEKNQKTEILLAALPHVAFDGWSEEVLIRAAKQVKADPAKIFPEGVYGLVLHFSEWADQEMLSQMDPKKMKSMRVRDKVALGVRERLELLAPYKEAMSAALSFMSMPPKSLHLPKLVWKTADKIWWAAGDTATDYNHYTKRILLSGVLSSTTLYWLNDQSEDHEKTWRFLDRRIDNILTVGKALSSLVKRA